MLSIEELGGWTERQTKLEKVELKPKATCGYWTVR